MCLISLVIVWLAAASVVQLEARSAAAQSAAARHVEMDNEAQFEPDHGGGDIVDEDEEEEDDDDTDSVRAEGDHVPQTSTAAWSCPSSPGPVLKFKITVAMLTIVLPLCVWKVRIAVMYEHAQVCFPVLNSIVSHDM